MRPVEAETGVDTGISQVLLSETRRGLARAVMLGTCSQGYYRLSNDIGRGSVGHKWSVIAGYLS